jgi:signal transduction histidine kinase/ligand-binding sensor domain-containing protein
MNQLLKKFCILFILLMPASHIIAQLEPAPAAYLNFSFITIKDGLSQGMINYMLQDHFGFMWFATKDGLNRYDGYHFVVYRNDASDAASLADNHVRVLFEDSKGRLWVGTENNGLDIFDRRTEKFIHFKHSANNANSISDNRIARITEDKSGAIWISTSAGINRIRFRNNDTLITSIDLHQSQQENNASFVSGKNTLLMPPLLFCDSKGMLWIFQQGESYQIKISGDAFKILPLNLSQLLQKKVEGLDYSILSYAEDTIRDCLYLISNRTVFRLQQQNGSIDYFDFSKYTRNVISDECTTDENGLIWLTNLGRLNTIDFASRTIRQVYYSHNGIVADGGFNVYRDHNGIIWVGTVGYGILKHLPRTSKFHFTAGNSVSFITEPFVDMLSIHSSIADDQLFDLNKGIVVEKIPPYQRVLQRFSPLYNYDFIFTDNRHAFVIKNSLYWCDKNYNNLQHLREVGEAPRVVVDGKGLWIGAVDSLCYLDETAHQLKCFGYPVIPYNAPYFFCMDIIKGIDDNVWLATMKGLLCFNAHTNTWKQYVHDGNDTTSLSSNIVFSICADPKQPGKYLWIGTEGGGLNRLDIASGKMKCYREKNGLPNSVVYGIVPDDHGNLWMSTNKGISNFNTTANTFTNYEDADGLQGNEFNRYAYGKSSSGWIYFGGINGFNYFRPNELQVDTVFSKVIFTDFKISNKSVAFSSNNSLLSKPVYLTQKIMLPYKYNMISFDFASVNFSQPEKNYYQYKLRGFDDDWIAAGKAHTATYTNLDPGTYTLNVRSSNYATVWGNDATAMEVIIIPPWYMTWWFRTSIVLLTVVALYTIYRYRLAQALKLQAVRNRIAADLHDEIGSTLSSISIFSEVIEDQTKEQLPEVTPVIKRISDSTQNMMEAMSDIVWTINPKNDRFENIISRMQAFASEMLEAVNCKLEMHVDEKTNSLKLPMETRKNFYLVFKEAINNIAKYAQANNVQVNVYIRNATLYLSIKDDGKGFELKYNSTGNGLLNMERRAAELKGKFQIHTAPGKGTELEVWFPV